MWQRSTGKHLRERSSNDGVVVADSTGSPRQMNAEFERGKDAVAAHRNCRSGGRCVVTLAHLLERKRLGVGEQPVAVHGDGVFVAEKTKRRGLGPTRRHLGEPNRFKSPLHEWQQIALAV